MLSDDCWLLIENRRCCCCWLPHYVMLHNVSSLNVCVCGYMGIYVYALFDGTQIDFFRTLTHHSSQCRVCCDYTQLSLFLVLFYSPFFCCLFCLFYLQLFTLWQTHIMSMCKKETYIHIWVARTNARNSGAKKRRGRGNKETEKWESGEVGEGQANRWHTLNLIPANKHWLARMGRRRGKGPSQGTGKRTV